MGARSDPRLVLFSSEDHGWTSAWETPFTEEAARHDGAPSFYMIDGYLNVPDPTFGKSQKPLVAGYKGDQVVEIVNDLFEAKTQDAIGKLAQKVLDA